MEEKKEIVSEAEIDFGEGKKPGQSGHRALQSFGNSELVPAPHRKHAPSIGSIEEEEHDGKQKENKETKEKKVPEVRASQEEKKNSVNRLGFHGEKIDFTQQKFDEKTLEAKMQSLKAATSNKKVAQRISRNKDTISTLLNSLNTKPKFTKMVEYSLECLTHLAVDEVSVEELIDEGALETLARLMKMNPYNEKIQQMINKCVESLAMSPKLQQRIAKTLGPLGFNFSLKKHTEPETLTSTASAVSKILKSESPESINIFHKSGTTTAVGEVIKNQSQQPDVQGASTEVLFHVSNEVPIATEVFQSGVFNNVLTALGEYPTHERLAEFGVGLGGRLAKASNDIREQIKKMGGVEIIMSVVEMHPEHEPILSAGSKALAALSGREDVASSMSVVVGNNLATAEAMSKLSSLLLVGENVDYLASHEGINWLVSAMKSVVGTKSEIASKILISGCRALARVATDEERIFGIITQGGVEVLLNVSTLHVNEPDVTIEAMRGLVRLATRKENCEFLLNTGAIDGALICMSRHVDLQKQSQIGLDLLNKISSHEGLVPGLVAKGVIKLTTDILTRHGADRAIVSSAISLLARCAITPEYMEQIVREGGIGKVVAMLLDHIGDAVIVKRCFQLIESAAELPSCGEALRQAGVMEAVMKGMNVHTDDATIQQMGSKITSMLMGIEQLRSTVTQLKSLVNRVEVNPTIGEKSEVFGELLQKVTLLSNLCTVDKNVDYLVEYGAIEILTLATTLPLQADKRSKIAAAAAAGLFRLAAHVAELEKKRWEEEEKRRQEEEEKRRKAMEQRRKEEEEKRRIEDEKRRIEEEKRRQEEEERRAAEEKARLEEEARREAEEKKRREEEEARRKEEEERRRKEEEERKKREEEERKRREEEERQRAEEERKRKEEEEKRRKEEEERRKKEEEERARREAEIKAIQEEAERKRREEEEKRRQEEEEKRRKEEEERRRKEEEERLKREEEERKRREEEERKRQEEEEKRRQEEEARRAAEEERRRKEEEERKRLEEERRKAEEERKRLEEERRKAEEEARRLEEERRKAEEAKRRAEEEAIEAELRRQEEEARKKREEELRKKDEITKVRAQLLHGLIQNNKVIKELIQAALDDPDNEELAEYVAKLAAECASDPSNTNSLIDSGLIQDLINLAKAHPLNEKVLLAVARALRYLSKDKQGLTKVLDSGGLDIIMQAVRANVGGPGLKDAIDVVIALTRDPKATVALVEQGAIDAIIEAMRIHADDPRVLHSCCAALCVLLVDEKVGGEIGAKGAIALTIAAMRKHYAEQSLCQVAMVLLDSLSSIPDNFKRFLAPGLGTVTLVKWVMDKYSTNEALVEAGTRLLATLLTPVDTEEKELLHKMTILDKVRAEKIVLDLLSRDDEHGFWVPDKISLINELVHLMDDNENAKIFYEADGLNALATMLNDSAGADDVMMTACSDAFLVITEHLSEDEALEVLDLDNIVETLATLLESKRPTVIKEERMKRVLNLLSKAKPKALEWKRQSPTALLNLLATCQDPMLLQQALTIIGKIVQRLSSLKALGDKFLALADIKALIRACRINWKNPGFLTPAAQLFGNLATSPPLKKQMYEEVPELILDMITHYPAVGALVGNCCYCLSILTTDCPEICKSVVDYMGVNTLINGMSRHALSGSILGYGIDTLINLAIAHPANKEVIITGGGLQVVADSTLAHFEQRDLLLTCFKALGILSYDHATISKTIKAGAVQGIVAAMTAHATDLEVIDLAIRLMTNLASDLDANNMKIMAEEGAVQAICEVAIQYMDNTDLLTTALGCLSNLAAAEYNAAMIIRHGGPEAMKGALNEHSNIAPLVRNAARLSHALSLCTDKSLVSKLVGGKLPHGLLRACERHHTDKETVLLGVMAISCMSFNQSNAQVIANAGAARFFTTVIKENPSHARLLIESYEGLSAVSRAEKAIAQIAELTLPTIPPVWTHHPDDVKIIIASLRALTNLCVEQGAADGVVHHKIIHHSMKIIKPRASTPNDVVMRTLKAWRNVAIAGSKETKAHMVKEGVVEECKPLESSPDANIKNTAGAIIDELTGRVRKKKTAREVFHEQKEKGLTISQEVRNLLLAGQLLKKYNSKSTGPAFHLRHLKVDNSLRWVIWKDPKKPLTKDAKCKMAVYNIRTIDKGRVTPALKRKKFGKPLCRDECCFAIIGRERTVDIETDTPEDREKWVHALRILVQYNSVRGEQAQLKSR